MYRNLLIVLIVAAALASPGGGVAAVASTKERMEGLRREIAHHDKLYFQQAAPEISDAAYDALKREVAGLERDNPEFAANPANRDSADDRDGRFPTLSHGVPMLSLAKVYDEEALRLFCEGLVRDAEVADSGFVVEPKVDGVAVSVVYVGGRLAHAVTRGNGTVGDDITENVLLIAGLPGELRVPEVGVPPERVELRGEIFFSLDEFARINREREAAGEDLFAHPRNLAAGTIKSLDSDLLRERRLSIVLFGWGRWLPAGSEPASQNAFRAQMKSWGLPVIEPASVAGDADAVLGAVRALAEQRPRLAYPIDGAVIKLDDTRLRRKIGDGADGPRWAVAFKYPPDRASTRLRSITWQVGRSGVLTPVAELDPVEIAGATIARASLHNPAVIARLDLREGDIVWVERAGEIIPQVAGVDFDRRQDGAAPFVVPEVCPSCGFAVAARDAGRVLSCANSACRAQLERRIAHFVAEPCLNIRGLGPAAIGRLVGAGVLRSSADLFRLRREDVEAAGISQSAAGKLLKAIAASRSVEFWRVLHGLGLPGVGPAMARQIAAIFPEAQALLQATAADFEQHSSITPVVAGEVLAFLGDSTKRAEFVQLIEMGVGVMGGAAERATARLAGKVFVFTGTLESLTRSSASARVEAAGGGVADEVSRGTDYLVAGFAPGSKLKRARGLGVPILDEAAFLDLLAELHPPPDL